MNISTIDHETLREVVRKSRRHHWLVKHRWFALCVGVPTLLAAVYYGLIASPIYVSQSSFVIKSPGQKGAPSLSLANSSRRADYRRARSRPRRSCNISSRATP